MTNKIKTDVDAIVIGSGFAGLALIHYLRDAGLSVKVFDKASDIGGTWTWNRYPGAMTDSEGYYYCLAFPKSFYKNGRGHSVTPRGKRRIAICILLLTNATCGLTSS